MCTIPLALLGLVFVWAFVGAVRDLVWEEWVRRRQWRREDEQQRRYRMGRR